MPPALARFLAAVEARDAEAAGREYAVACTAVVEIDPEADRITAFRDYVDLGAWRARLAEALS